MSQFRNQFFESQSNLLRISTSGVKKDRIVRIDNQSSLASMTYHIMNSYWYHTLNITEENFIRMWRTLILMRVQDVFSMEKCHDCDNYVGKIRRTVRVPAPLWDLLSSLGQFQSTATGITYDIVPPAYPATPPDWWLVNPEIVRQWVHMMNICWNYYEIRQFPSRDDYKQKPLVLTSRKDIGLERSVRALTNEFQPSDALIRFVNDDIFERTNNGMESEDCHINVIPHTHLGFKMRDYVKSYEKEYKPRR